MFDNKITQAIEQLKTSGQADDPAIQTLIQTLETRGDIIGGDQLTVRDISDSTGVAIGRNIRQVINQINLPPETVGTLIDLLQQFGTSVSPILDPDHYWLGTLIAEKAAGFVGREYVFEAIEDFLGSKIKGYFTIEADPGIGKSAILAEYVRRTGCITHFNVRSQGINTARHFLQSVCAQLIVDFGLPYSALPPDATQDGAFLASLLDEAIANLPPGERLVIAVDALDEVDLTGHPDGPNILFLPPTLPDGVYFIMTRRQVDLPFVAQVPQQLFDLMAYPAESRADVVTYISRAADEREGLRSWIEQQGLAVEDFVETLADLSQNNFMYLRYVLPEIEEGMYDDLSIENLPAGLEAYYEDHWRRMGMMARELPHKKLRIVYILSVVRQPVSRALITQFADNESLPVSALDVQAVLDEWDQFLREYPHEEGTRYAVYHASFRDFLHRKDIVQAAGLTIEGVHGLIADDLWEDLFPDG